jgi:hypothetical protein
MKIIITESQYRFLVENTSEIDNILDKMNEIGYENLKNDEKMTLKQYSEWLNSGKKGDFMGKNTQNNDDFDKNTGNKYTTILKDNSDFSFTYDYSDILDNENIYYGSVEWDGESWYGLVATDKKGYLTDFDFISDQTMFYHYDNSKSTNIEDKPKEKRLQDSLGTLIHEVKFFFEDEIIPSL